MFEPLDELYFKWLYGQISDPEITDPSLTYWNVLRKLYQTEFKGRIPNDENRLADGVELRVEFLHSEGITSVDDVDIHWLELDCSFLELMVGLSRRLAYESIDGGEPHFWFWQLMENLSLLRYNDSRKLMIKRIDGILDRVIERQYEANGDGGFFPLRYPTQDQREVELWYQLNAYLQELEREEG